MTRLLSSGVSTQCHMTALVYKCPKICRKGDGGEKHYSPLPQWAGHMDMGLNSSKADLDQLSVKTYITKLLL